MNVPRLEKEIGIRVYATKTPGIGGRLRQFPEDFMVEEVLENGSAAKIEPPNIANITGHGRYLVWVLVKRNMDIFQAVQTIANILGISTERIQVAGIKDANAVTAQHVSISRMLPEQATQIKTSNLWLYPLQFSNEKIHSGMLFGNQFRITMRAINHPRSTITKRLENTNRELLKLGGCPNFFGHQRFGTARAITHTVGKHIILGEWEKAALTFIAKPSPYEHPESRQARQKLLGTQNYKEALSYFPPRLVYERQMLNHLAKQHKDFMGAFHRLPKKLCQLFIHAYQSYLFNKFLSQRIQDNMQLKKPLKEDCKLTVNNEDYLALPLVGYKLAPSTGKQGEIEKRTLKEEGVEPQNFRVTGMPEISSKGGLRTALTQLINLKMVEPSNNGANLSNKMISLNFVLRKGSYATIVLRELMKPRDPIKAGY